MLEESEILSQQVPAPATHTGPKGGVREMLGIALPMVMSLSFDTLMVFIDRIYLSRLGPEYMSASLAGGNASFLLLTFFMGLIGYATALVAQNLGAGHPENGSKVLSHALGIAILSYPILLLLRPLGAVLFSKAGIDPLQLPPQIIFFETLVLGSLIPLFRHSFASFFSGIGETRIVMIASLVGLVTNCTMNYALIFGHFGFPALGIRGAAIGTILAGAASLLVLVSKYFSKDIRSRFHHPHSWKFYPGLLKEYVTKGAPSGIEFGLNMLAFQCMILIFDSRGLANATAATIMFNWDMVTFVPLMGLEVAATSLVGRYYGARDAISAKRVTRSGILMGWVFSLVVLVAFLGIPEMLVNVFRPTPPGPIFLEAFPLAVLMIRIAAIYLLIESIMVVYAGALRGTGDTLWTMIIMVGLHWSLVLMLWLSFRYFDLGIITSWSVLVAGFMLFPLLLWMRWRIVARKRITFADA